MHAKAKREPTCRFRYDKIYRKDVLLHGWKCCRATGGALPLRILRPLGVRRIKDRVAQMAAVLILEPIFEADLPEEQNGYRRGRSAHDAIRTVHGLLNRG